MTYEGYTSKTSKQGRAFFALWCSSVLAGAALEAEIASPSAWHLAWAIILLIFSAILAAGGAIANRVVTVIEPIREPKERDDR